MNLLIQSWKNKFWNKLDCKQQKYKPHALNCTLLAAVLLGLINQSRREPAEETRKL